MRRSLIVLAVLLVLAGLGAYLLEGVAYSVKRGCHLASLPAAISTYCQQYGALPASLEAAQRTGLYDDYPYRTPVNGWEDQPYSGPPPLYLPVTVPDAGGGFVIAVEAKTARTPKNRGYVLLGDTAIRFAGPAELAMLLAADDARRAEVGEPRRWSQVLDVAPGN